MLQQFRSGDSDAVAHVAALTRLVVRSSAYYIPAGEREDVAQEAVLDIYRTVTRPGFGLRRNLDAIVRSIAHRRCVDWLRRQRAASPIGPDVAAESTRPDRILASKETAELILRTLERLGPSCRDLIRLRVVEDLSFRRIAERLERTEGGVRTRMYKCLREARRIFRELGGTDSAESRR